MARPRFDELYMNLAVGLSHRSTCGRLQVGCVITSEDHRYVYGVGYNGGASGLDNDCESAEPGQCGHIHAEANAIINCRAERLAPKIVYVTHLPCKMCAKMLINLGGVVSVRYAEDYRDRTSLTLFDRADIRHMRYMS